jgi:hypothetical protein
MRKLLRRLTSSSCSRCRGRVSPYAVACADCGSNIRGGAAASVLRGRRDSALVWLLGGALLGCITMLALSSH